MEKPSIAVLPSGNTCDDLNLEYFSDGIGDELIAGFSEIPRLIVIAPNSAFAFVKCMS